MATQRTSLNVSLTPELEQFIAARVASGRYQTASEVVRAALRLLEQSDCRVNKGFCIAKTLRCSPMHALALGASPDERARYD